MTRSAESRIYQGIYQRYRSDPNNISFNDIIVAQQTLSATLSQYLSILQSQWLGVVDVAELLQADDLFQLGDASEVAQIPDVVVEGSAPNAVDNAVPQL